MNGQLGDRERVITLTYGRVCQTHPWILLDRVARAYDRLYAHGTDPTPEGLARAVAGGYPRDEG